MSELKSCPFCGENLSYLCRWMEYYHADTGSCIFDGVGFPDTEEFAEMWNMRRGDL